MFGWPMPGTIRQTRDFYFRDSLYADGRHGGSDFVRVDVTTRGSPIVAIAAGIAYAPSTYDYYGGYVVQVAHADGWTSQYRHLIGQILPVNRQIAVAAGQIIGYADNTGVSSGDHLHFDLWNTRQRSPEAYLSRIGWWKHDPMKWLGTAAAPTIKGGFLMALTDAEQAEALQRLRNLDAENDEELRRQQRIMEMLDEAINDRRAIMRGAEFHMIIRERIREVLREPEFNH